MGGMPSSADDVHRLGAVGDGGAVLVTQLAKLAAGIGVACRLRVGRHDQPRLAQLGGDAGVQRIGAGAHHECAAGRAHHRAGLVGGKLTLGDQAGDRRGDQSGHRPDIRGDLALGEDANQQRTHIGVDGIGHLDEVLQRLVGARAGPALHCRGDQRRRAGGKVGLEIEHDLRGGIAAFGDGHRELGLAPRHKARRRDAAARSKVGDELVGSDAVDLTFQHGLRQRVDGAVAVQGGGHARDELRRAGVGGGQLGGESDRHDQLRQRRIGDGPHQRHEIDLAAAALDGLPHADHRLGDGVGAGIAQFAQDRGSGQEMRRGCSSNLPHFHRRVGDERRVEGAGQRFADRLEDGQQRAVVQRVGRQRPVGEQEAGGLLELGGVERAVG